MNLDEANNLWFNSEPIEGILFNYNDPVRLVSGKYSGECASVISLLSLEPVTYLVELDSGDGDITVLEAEMKRCG